MTHEAALQPDPGSPDQAPRPPADTPRQGDPSLGYIGDRLIRPEVLSAMWAAGKWRYPCPKDCGGTLYVDGMGGSPLTGAGKIWGECTHCGDVSVERHTVAWSVEVLYAALEHGDFPSSRDKDPIARLTVDLTRPRGSNRLR